MRLIRLNTPNFNYRPAWAKVRLIVLHSDASPRFSSTRSWIESAKSGVSYHTIVDRDGTGYRFVEDKDRAWAVGKSVWRGHVGCNSISLSASFANLNDGKEPLTAAQIAWMKEMVAFWRTAHPTIEAVETHAAVSPGRKFDPIRAPNFRIEEY